VRVPANAAGERHAERRGRRHLAGRDGDTSGQSADTRAHYGGDCPSHRGAYYGGDCPSHRGAYNGTHLGTHPRTHHESDRWIDQWHHYDLQQPG
jgi:hypothetical protein